MFLVDFEGLPISEVWSFLRAIALVGHTDGEILPCPAISPCSTNEVITGYAKGRSDLKGGYCVRLRESARRLH